MREGAWCIDLNFPPISQVSLLILDLLVNLISLIGNFLNHSSLVTTSFITSNLRIVCFHLICKFLYGANFLVTDSICLTQWMFIGLIYKDNGIWMWLWRSRLVIVMGYNCRNDRFCACLATVFSRKCIFFCWFSFWYCLPFRACCRGLATIPPLPKGDWMMELVLENMDLQFLKLLFLSQTPTMWVLLEFPWKMVVCLAG